MRAQRSKRITASLAGAIDAWYNATIDGDTAVITLPDAADRKFKALFALQRRPRPPQHPQPPAAPHLGHWRGLQPGGARGGATCAGA